MPLFVTCGQCKKEYGTAVQTTDLYKKILSILLRKYGPWHRQGRLAPLRTPEG